MDKRGKSGNSFAARVEFGASGRKLLEIRRPYVGPWALASGDPWLEVEAYGFQADGAESGTLLSQDSQQTLTTDTIYFVRFRIKNTGTYSYKNLAITFEYNHNSGGWNSITSSSTVAQGVDSSNVAQYDDCTEKLSGGTGTWVSNNDGVADGGGDCGGSNLDLDVNYYAEVLCVLQINSAYVSDGDEVLIRPVISGGTPLDAYNSKEADIDVDEPVLPIERTVSDTLTLSDTHTRAGSFVRPISDSATLSDQASGQVVSIIERAINDTATLTDEQLGGAGVDQDSYAFYEDDADEDTSTLIGSANAQQTLQTDRNYQARLLFQEVLGGEQDDYRLWWQARLNGGSWYNCSTSTNAAGVKVSDSPNMLHNDDVTQRIGSGPYESSNSATCDTSGLTNWAVPNLSPGYEWESVLCFQLDSSVVKDGDQIEFRCTRTSAEPGDPSPTQWDLYSYTRYADCLAFVPEIEDTVTLSDEVARDVIATAIERTISDTLTATDAATRVGTFVRPINDTPSLSDETDRTVEAGGTTYERTATDTLTATDTQDRAGTWVRPAADAATVADASARAAVLEREADDATTLTDTQTRVATYQRGESDAATIADAGARAIELERADSDAASLTDATARGDTWSRAFEDTASIADDADGQVLGTITRAISDTLSVSDDAIRAGAWTRSIDDAVSVAEAFARDLEIERADSDAATASDSSSRTVTLERPSTDTVSVSDSASSEQSGVIYRTSSDALSVADAQARQSTLWRSANDTATIADSSARDIQAGVLERAASDALALTDGAARGTIYTRPATDTATITDAATSETVPSSIERAINDTLAIADAAAFEFMTQAPLTAAAVNSQLSAVASSPQLGAAATSTQLFAENPNG